MGTSVDTNIPGGERGQPKTNPINAVFTNKKDNSTMNQSDFMKLMVAQMQNQDFMNPMDDKQMVDQMVAFSNMQQMQEMASYSKSQYAMSLLGKTVTAARFTVGGDLDTTTGAVQRLSLVDDEYVLYIGGKKYEMSEIMGIGNSTDSSVSPISPESFPLVADSVDIKTDSAVVKWRTPTEDAMTAKGLTYSVYVSKKYVEEAEKPEVPPEKPVEPPETEDTEKTGTTEDPGKPPETEKPEDPDKKPVYKDIKFDTVALVEKGTAVASGDKIGKADESGVFSQLITGLEPGTVYYVNVVVTDASGKKSVYKPITVTTLKSLD